MTYETHYVVFESESRELANDISIAITNIVPGVIAWVEGFDDSPCYSVTADISDERYTPTTLAMIDGACRAIAWQLELDKV